MPSGYSSVTPHPDVNRILSDLVPGICAVLGADLIGLYLDGSLARGDFDAASDIDFVAVTREMVSAAQFEALQALHDRIAAGGENLALEIEGFYVPLAALRGPGAPDLICPNLERGPGERLKWIPLGPGWAVHRWILREYGIVLSGPHPDEIGDPVTAVDLKDAMRRILEHWATRIADDPALLRHSGYQAYAILSICRILYTLAHGTIVSKAAAAAWARQALEPRWAAGIEAALETRLAARGDATPEQTAAAEAFIRYAIGG